MVRAEVTVPEPGVMAAGEKAQLKPPERPLQESEMELLKEPDCGFAVTVNPPDCPAGIVMDEGAALKDTVDDAPPEQHVGRELRALVIWFAMLGLPTACINNL